jgi:hypothetical protein
MDREDQLKQIIFGAALLGFLWLNKRPPREEYGKLPEQQFTPIYNTHNAHNGRNTQYNTHPFASPQDHLDFTLIEAEPIRPLRPNNNSTRLEPNFAEEGSNSILITTNPGSRFGMSMRPSLEDAMNRPMERVRVKDTVNTCPPCPTLPVIEITDNTQRKVLAKTFGQVVVLVHQNQRMLLRAFADLVHNYPSILFATEDSSMGLIPNLPQYSPVLVLDRNTGTRTISTEIANVGELEIELARLLES